MFENETWRIGANIAMVALAIAIALVAHTLLFRLFGRVKFGVEGSVIRHARKPMRVLLPLIAVLLVLPLIDIAPSTAEFVARAIALAIIGCFGWLAVSLMSVFEDLIAAKYPVEAADNLEARAVRTRMRVLRSAAVVVIAVITASVILMSFPSVRQLGVSLLASAGLLALVVGMAARPALENLIAGMQLALTQPVKLDDVVVIEGEWGRIEEITTTYIVVRIWDARRLVLPLSYFITNPIENWTYKTSDLLGTVIVHADYTVPVEEVRGELQGLLEATPLWDRRAWGLQVVNTTTTTMELRALMSAKDSGDAWNLRCYVREGLIRVLQERWPDSLPRIRTEMEWPAGADGARLAPQH